MKTVSTDRYFSDSTDLFSKDFFPFYYHLTHLIRLFVFEAVGRSLECNLC